LSFGGDGAPGVFLRTGYTWSVSVRAPRYVVAGHLPLSAMNFRQLSR
jgi:hypothetical protein